MTRPLARSLLYLAFLVSGVTALVYEILWSRYLALLVGGTSLSHTIVLGTFMGGLALGNALFGRVADRSSNRLRLYALLEVGIGLGCLLYPWVFATLGSLYLRVGASLGPQAALNPLLKVALAAASMFVPCAFMGGTLPVLARYVVGSMSDLGARIGWLYFINTAGAVLGCLLGGFYVVETLGLEAGMVATSLVNLAIGAAFYLASRRPAAGEGGTAAAGEPAAEGSAPVEYTPAQARTAFWCIAAAGGVSMLYELVWIRLLVLSMGGTVHSFSTMLAGFITGIAIGSALAARLMARPRNALALFGLCEAGLAAAILLGLPEYEKFPYAFYRVGLWLSHSPETYPLYLAAQVAMACAVMIVPTTLMGAALPLASRVCVDALQRVGSRVGDVFSANTIGTLVGTALTGFVLLPVLGLHHTLVVGVAVSGALGIVLLRAWRPAGTGGPLKALREAVRPQVAAQGPRLWVAAAAGLVGLALVRLGPHPQWDSRLMERGLYRWEQSGTPLSWEAFAGYARARHVLFARDGADATISVVESGPGHRAVTVNGKPDASTVDMSTQLMVGHLPMFLHPNPQRAMVVGLGCGATAAAVLRHPGVTADVAEISPEMVEAARYFEAVNDHVLDNPHMRLSVMDAREFLLLTRERYDVIVSEPTNLWIPGVATLFTRDFYGTVREHLRPGGIFVQWMQLYAADRNMVASVVSTVSESFPYVSAWLIVDSDFILVASDHRPEFDPAVFARRLQEVAPSRGLPWPNDDLALFKHPLLFLANQVGTNDGVRTVWPGRAAVRFADLKPRLEFQAARAQFVGKGYDLRADLDERLARRGAEPLFLEQYLQRFPVERADRASFWGVLRSLPAQYQDLGHALAVEAVLEGDTNPDLLIGLPDEIVAKVLYVAALGTTLDGPRPDVASCRTYLESHGQLLRVAASAFGRPAPGRLVERMDRCAAALPREAPEWQLRLATVLAESGETDLALGRIDALEASGALVSLRAAQRAELLATGAELLLQSGRRAEALAWLERARALDGQNPRVVRLGLVLLS
jgi:spermidine synthase